MAIVTVSVEDWPQFERFVSRAKHLYADTGREDLRGLIRSHIAIAGIENGEPWGLLVLQVELRPDTLPLEAPDRVFLRFVALSDGRSPIIDVGTLFEYAWPLVAQRSSHARVQAYGRERWVVKPLQETGFAIVERIEFLRLERLQQRWLPTSKETGSILMRPATTQDLALLSRLDAHAFPPRWHFSESELLTLLMGGRVELAMVDEKLVGYWALSLASEGSAHLSRLAVHPDFHRRGVGRHLLADALAFARRERFHSIMLNTQTDNLSAQSLYRSFGFRSTGRIVPILIYPPV